MLPEPELEMGPGSSSYELKAIADDSGQAIPPADNDDPWEEPEPPPSFNGNGHGLLGLAPASSPDVEASWEKAVPRGASGAFREDPWYSRVLQLWGIMFLVWAALIVGRCVFIQFGAGGGATNSTDVVSSIVSVMLLVPGAAGLFLLVDLGRYIRGLRPGPQGNPKAAPDLARPEPLGYRPGRVWNRLFHGAFSARP